MRQQPLGNETTMHRSGITEMYAYFSRYYSHIEHEVYLKDLKQRPDLLIVKPNGDLLVIEYQCARLSYQQLKIRCDGYQQLQIPCLWFLGEKYLQEIPFPFICLEAGQLFAWYWIDQRPQKLCFNQPKQGARQWQQINADGLLRKIQLNIMKRKAPYLKLQHIVYQLGGNLRQLPRCCLSIGALSIGPKVPDWYVLYRLYLELLKGPQSKAMLFKCLDMLPWHQSVFLKQADWCQLVLNEIIEMWRQQHVLLESKGHFWLQLENHHQID